MACNSLPAAQYGTLQLSGRAGIHAIKCPALLWHGSQPYHLLQLCCPVASAALWLQSSKIYAPTLLSVQDYIRKKNKWLVKIHEWVQANGGDPIIPFSGAYENEVSLAPAGKSIS